ncbi:hypothetical protein PLESTB_000003300 [Pleodorina starrii]|uniref:Uncharacterized protein n=1 Tax=Pleodorina starrii TaxID=330485 RepID=A0A9W6EWG7_9CHLO|nr:hypothetical protein PLESTM_000351800 [Pleodorina starrii]GLC47579.1 hypothetical protein PLESTB_000003300 [Pleodorina starrii]GLC76863.1 hypothetical protein PLESTF_001849200 [Pleodorina starrii]
MVSTPKSKEQQSGTDARLRAKRPNNFYAALNTWWRDQHEKTGERPKVDEVRQWYADNAVTAWPIPELRPSLEEVEKTAKGLRTKDKVKVYFRAYRKACKEKRATGETRHRGQRAARSDLDGAQANGDAAMEEDVSPVVSRPLGAGPSVGAPVAAAPRVEINRPLIAALHRVMAIMNSASRSAAQQQCSPAPASPAQLPNMPLDANAAATVLRLSSLLRGPNAAPAPVHITSEAAAAPAASPVPVHITSPVAASTAAAPAPLRVTSAVAASAAAAPTALPASLHVTSAAAAAAQRCGYGHGRSARPASLYDSDSGSDSEELTDREDRDRMCADRGVATASGSPSPECEPLGAQQQQWEQQEQEEQHHGHYHRHHSHYQQHRQAPFSPLPLPVAAYWYAYTYWYAVGWCTRRNITGSFNVGPLDWLP